MKNNNNKTGTAFAADKQLRNVSPTLFKTALAELIEHFQTMNNEPKTPRRWIIDATIEIYEHLQSMWPDATLEHIRHAWKIGLVADSRINNFRISAWKYIFWIDAHKYESIRRVNATKKPVTDGNVHLPKL